MSVTKSENIRSFVRRWLIDPQTSIWHWRFWKRYFSKPQNDITLVLLTKQHLEVQKIKLSPTTLLCLKVGAFFGIAFSLVSSVFFIDYLVKLPQNALIRDENRALRMELNKLQFNLDNLQTTMDRMARFDQKLRALTDVDREFEKARGPAQGVGGPLELANDDSEFGELSVDSKILTIEPDTELVLDRRESFAIQRMYGWMRGMFQDAILREQSLEELFEVLKGREIQLAATPSILPTNGWVTSHFGYRIDPFNERRVLHKGLDIAARSGSPVLAPAEGVVTFAGQNGGYGRTVMLFHGYGISTLYAHLSDISVKEGQKVSRGDQIAAVGSSGRSTGSHLHYEVVMHGVHVDPRKFILDRSL